MRFFVLILSMSSVLFFSYAIAGMGGFMFGRGRLDYIAFGLLAGGGAAVSAIWLWRRWLVPADLEASSKGSGESLSRDDD